MKKLIALVLTLSLVAGVVASADAAAKKVVKKKVVKKKVVKPVKKPVKPAPVTPWVPPAPAPVAPAPAAAPAAAGMGLSLGGNIGTKAGLTAISGKLDYSIASMLAGASIRVGGDYLTGTNGVDTNLKVVTLKLDGIYALDMLKQPGLPVDFYIGGGALYAVKVSNAFTGSYGLEAFIGANYKIPDFGCLNAEVGYAALKYGGKAGAAKGVEASVGYSYAF